jgi:hypothetical protein
VRLKTNFVFSSDVIKSKLQFIYFFRSTGIAPQLQFIEKKPSLLHGGVFKVAKGNKKLEVKNEPKTDWASEFFAGEVCAILATPEIPAKTRNR